MSEWQPIKTAPKGMAVLVWAPDHRGEVEGVFRWGKPADPGVVIAVFDNDRWLSDLVEFEGGWDSTGSYTVTVELSPTHWMPLPEPPGK